VHPPPPPLPPHDPMYEQSSVGVVGLTMWLGDPCPEPRVHPRPESQASGSWLPQEGPCLGCLPLGFPSLSLSSPHIREVSRPWEQSCLSSHPLFQVVTSHLCLSQAVLLVGVRRWETETLLRWGQGSLPCAGWWHSDPCRVGPPPWGPGQEGPISGPRLLLWSSDPLANLHEDWVRRSSFPLLGGRSYWAVAGQAPRACLPPPPLLPRPQRYNWPWEQCPPPGPLGSLLPCRRGACVGLWRLLLGLGGSFCLSLQPGFTQEKDTPNICSCPPWPTWLELSLKMAEPADQPMLSPGVDPCHPPLGTLYLHLPCAQR
jgi:hypothetical protein